MNRILLLFRDGGLLDTKGCLAPGVISALSELQQAGFKLAVLYPRAPAQTDRRNTRVDGANTLNTLPLSTNQLLSVLASQQVTIDHCCEFDSATTESIAGLLAPWLIQQTVSTENSIVAGGAAAATDLARHLEFKAYVPLLKLDGDQQFTGDIDSRAPESSGVQSSEVSELQTDYWTVFAAKITNQPRTAVVVRNSNETAIRVSVDLDSPERNITVSTGIGFFDHMVEQVAKHGGFSLQLVCDGDLHIDEHHTVEDCALALGQALREALGDKHGIGRYGFVLPMDEAEVRVSLDLSARPYFVFNGEFSREHVGELTTEMVPHFFKSLSDTLGASLHITMSGDNAHHQVEVIFKGVGRTLRQALRREGNELPSTKGML